MVYGQLYFFLMSYERKKKINPLANLFAALQLVSIIHHAILHVSRKSNFFTSRNFNTKGMVTHF